MSEKKSKTQHLFERALVVVALGALVILLTTAARQMQPPIPHDLIGREDCLSCHKEGVNGAPKYPADHAGRTNDVCQGCHKQVAASSAPTAQPTVAATASAPAAQPTSAALPIPHDIAGHENCTQCHPVSQPATAPAAGGPPLIPHDVIGRDDCLVCHGTGQAGAPKVPADHAGRTNDMCRTCHQPGVKQTNPPTPTPAAPPPTPVSHPPAGGKNSCADCHKTLNDRLKQPVTDWENSIHAQRNVGCADCHGGDPTSADPNRAMASAAGYIGVPNGKDIPALCGSCHSNVDMMRQYDLPTDQLSKYKESKHGQMLAKGDLNVATCFDCHDGHATRQVNDPASNVYPFNVPALCARCHANAELMKPYGIPTNQYDLFKASVHGIALLKNQDTRAPSCATCHGTHGATPPGFEEVANVCGSCHGATQEYFLKSQHASVQGGPKCVTCHGRYDVGVPSDEMFIGNADRQCGQCHPAGSPQAGEVKQIYDALHQATTTYDDAEKAIAKAASLQMIVAPEEAQLQQAKTSLLTARAAQHTGQLADVTHETDKAISISQQAEQAAETKISESIFRRQAMVIAVIVIALVVVSLVIVKRSLGA
jgi:hypothetical protein